jgi:hypothetical protein
MSRLLVLAAVAVALAACATPYVQEGLVGGFDAKNLGQDVYRVRFAGNGYTSRETAQTYWLYRSAELALENGFTGFEILSDVPFVMRRPEFDDGPRQAPGSIVAASNSVHIPASPIELAGASVSPSGGKDTVGGEFGERIRVAAVVPIFIPSGGTVARPLIEADVHFIKRPVESTPPRVFNAKALKAALEPIVTAERCGMGNVCPHVHEYLLPKGKLQ